MGFNSPLPQDLADECRKAAKILRQFIIPDRDFGPDKYIPHDILARARGLVVLTVVKAGFLFSARMGSGLVIARLGENGLCVLLIACRA